MYMVELLEWSDKPEFRQIFKWLSELLCSEVDVGFRVFLKKVEDYYLTLYLYTDEYRYEIRVIAAYNGGIAGAHSSYLGVTYSTRKNDCGEDWSRGKDLADGSFDINTWNHILRDIIRIELKRISRYQLEKYEVKVEYSVFLQKLSECETGDKCLVNIL